MKEGINQAVTLAPIETISWVLLGIILSLLLPIAVRTLQRARSEGLEGLEGANKLSVSQRIAAAWNKYEGNKYLFIFLAAILVAIVLVFLLGLEFYTPRDATLAGFAWESLINKLFPSSKKA